MRKKLMLGAAAMTISTMAAAGMAATAGALPLPTWRANEPTNFAITKIVPAEQRMEIAVDIQEGEPEGLVPNMIYISYGGNMTDYDLWLMRYAWEPAGSTRVLSKTRAALGADFSTPVTITAAEMAPGADLTKTTRLEYSVEMSNFQDNAGRVDFSRCVNSSVFKSGAATECWMEKRADGRLQYQPYTAAGERVEIPEAEDKILTAKTDYWVPESGVWPDGWYTPVPEEPDGPDDGGGGNGEDNGDNGGGSGENGDNNGGNSGENGGENGSDNGGAEDDGDSGNGTAEQGNTVNNSDNGANNSGNGTGNSENNADNSSESTSGNSEAESSNSGNNSAEDGGVNSASENASEVTLAWLPGDYWVTNTETIEGEGAENDNDGAAAIAAPGKDNEDDAAEVATPELGQKTEGMPAFLQALLVALGTFAAIMLWWLLFFGRRKNNEERKENES